MTQFARAATIVLLLLATGCGSGGRRAAQSKQSTRPETTSGQANAPGAGTHLTDLHDIAQLQSLFNTRSGEPRLILLVSPT